MRAFVEIEVAETCYPYEAAAWVAFGRVPEVHIYEDGSDARGSTAAIGEGYAPEDATLHRLGELISFVDKPEDVARYLKAKYIAPGSDNVFDYFNEYLVQEPIEYPPRQGPRTREGYIESLFVQSIDERIERAMERAELKLLVKLMEGQIVARGVRVPDALFLREEDGWDEGDWRKFEGIEPSDIPAEEWLNRPEPWAVSPDEIRIGRYYYPVLKFEDVFKEFPIPDVGEETFTAVRRGGTVVVNDGDIGHRTVSKTLRGRNPLGGGAIRTAIVNEFQRREAEAKNPDKVEALLQDAIDWASRTFNESISRSTIQRYLGPVLSARKSAQN